MHAIGFGVLWHHRSSVAREQAAVTLRPWSCPRLVQPVRFRGLWHFLRSVRILLRPVALRPEYGKIVTTLHAILMIFAETMDLAWRHFVAVDLGSVWSTRGGISSNTTWRSAACCCCSGQSEQRLDYVRCDRWNRDVVILFRHLDVFCVIHRLYLVRLHLLAHFLNEMRGSGSPAAPRATLSAITVRFFANS
jgi:hypothetical protein